MAVYAAVVSLMSIMDNIQNHPRVSTFIDKNQIQSLSEKLEFMLDFVESYDSYGGKSKEVEDLESQIVHAAQGAEDVIESHIVDRIAAGSAPDHGETSSSFKKALKKEVMKVREKIRSRVDKLCRRLEVLLPRSTGKSPNFSLDLHEIIEEMDSIKEKMIKIDKESDLRDQHLRSTMPAASSRPLPTKNTTVVGFDDYLVQLKDWLTTGQQPDRRMIPITGMGGIGKTTLARIVYENPLIVQHFDIRAWVTISQEHNMIKILSEIHSCLGDTTDGTETEDQLGIKLHKILFGRRYLVILDDIWSIDAWNKIKFFFPENDNTSRIVVTTRQYDVANHCGSLRLSVDFLDDNTSWDLFCEKVFVENRCPTDLEEIGKKIVCKCKGLPLAIVVIGGLLGKSFMKLEDWENVENDLSSTLNSVEDNLCLNILSLSYNHLPVYLKPCFLYLGIFPEDHKIHVAQLIKLWVAEGFLKPNTEQSLEEVAEGYIKDLIDRNLILISELGRNGTVKTCSLHDLLRDLCLKIAEKERFFFVIRELDSPREMDREHRVIIHECIADNEYDIQLSLKSARSAITRGQHRFFVNSRLLRVMTDAYSSLKSTCQHFNMRFLDDRYCGQHYISRNEWLPPSISLFWNLQTLIVFGSVKLVAPSEIWDMPQLRHFRNGSIIFPDPPLSGKEDRIVLRNLQTLKWVQNFRCSEEVCKRIPNIRKLGITFGHSFRMVEPISYYCHYNIGCLDRLESLQYNFKGVSNRDELVQNLKFPSSLKKLTLEHCRLNWDDLTMVAWLPHLEVLKLDSSTQGPEWNSIEGGFCCLKYLGIYRCDDLISWNADNSHFPVLEKLALEGLPNLDEIPLGIGDIPTLGDIFLFRCNVFLTISAMRILEEQESNENESIRVRVRVWEETEPEQQVELEGLSFPRH